MEETIRPYVLLVVINLVRHTTTWQVNWSERSSAISGDHDIDDLTDRLLAGTDRSMAARIELEELAGQHPGDSPLTENEFQ